MDALSLLKKDHSAVKSLFDRADELGDRAHSARQRLFEEISQELAVHTQIEEQIFYPAFKARSKKGTADFDEVLEAFEEHAAAKDLIAKL